MSANAIFQARKAPWYGLGTRVNEAQGSESALIAAGLNWNVVQEPIYTQEEELIDIEQVQGNIERIKAEIAVVEAQMAQYLKELGL